MCVPTSNGVMMVYIKNARYAMDVPEKTHRSLSTFTLQFAPAGLEDTHGYNIDLFFLDHEVKKVYREKVLSYINEARRRVSDRESSSSCSIKRKEK